MSLGVHWMQGCSWRSLEGVGCGKCLGELSGTYEELFSTKVAFWWKMTFITGAFSGTVSGKLSQGVYGCRGTFRGGWSRGLLCYWSVHIGCRWLLLDVVG